MRLLIDTNVLVQICHPKRYADVKNWIDAWFKLALERDDVEIFLSAVADFELRRGYLWKLDRYPNAPKGLNRLDQIGRLLGVYPVSNDHFLSAAQHWANARRGGYSTAPERDVDWDVIIARQAADLNAIVVTYNTKHLIRYGVDAKQWSEIPAPTNRM